jgi:DNA-binding Lrp family transcriptional regulator
MDEEKEKLKKILESIRKAAQLIQEHEASRSLRNGIVRLGSETIQSLAKEGLALIENPSNQG